MVRSTYAAAVSARSAAACAADRTGDGANGDAAAGGAAGAWELADLAEAALEVALAEQRLHSCVRQLRRQRVTWAEIGGALNVSRQAAWQRFATKLSE